MLPIRVDCWNALPTEEHVGATVYIVGVNGSSVLAWWIRHCDVDWVGNTPLDKKQGEAVVSWVNVLGLGPFAYEKRHAACWGVLWGSLMLEGNIFFFFCFILYSHPVYQTHLPLFFSLPSIVVQHRPANKKVPNKDKKPNT